MSTASISYSSLWDAAGEARDVAKKLDKYADSINSTVYKKLNSYEGAWTSNITSARSKANAKISELRTEAGKYRTYADELDDLRKECESVDRTVKSKVSSLTASFKAAHGINNNVVINSISYFFTSIGNSSNVGRWLNEKADQINSGVDYLKQRIEDWYDYNGGKEFIKGFLVGVLEIAIAVVGILAVVFGTVTGVWALVVAIASVVGGVIAIFNGVTNLVNEVQALGYASDDPATAKRESDLNTLSDTIRKDYDSKFAHFIAGGLDFVSFVCTAITFVDGAQKLLTKGFKWVKQTDFKKIFSKESFANLKDMGKIFKQGGMEAFKGFKADVIKNLKNEYFKFTDINGSFSLVDTLKSVKNMLGIPKDLIEGGFNFENFKDVFIDKIVFTGITLFAFEDDKVQGYEVGSGGQMQMDFTNNTTIGKPINTWEKGGKLLDTFIGFFDDGYVDLSIDIPDVVGKLNQVQPISVSVPAIPIPEINVGYVQVA